MNTIIVAANFSPEANNAVKYAAALAKGYNVRLVLFHSYQLSVHASNARLSPLALDGMYAQNKQRLKALAEATAAAYQIPVDFAIRRGDLQEDIDLLVESLGADLVVMGMSEFYLDHQWDNTTTSVISHARFPVLAVPEKASFNGISNILFAYDSTEVREEKKLGLLKELAKKFKAQVKVYYVENNVKSAAPAVSSSSVEAILQEVDHSCDGFYDEDIIAGLKKGIKESNADLLVMVPHKYGFWEGLWHKSKTRAMACKSEIPLLALPD